MATQTIIDGGKQAITFNNDTEPCAVYVDEELQQNVSFVPQTVRGTGVVSYASEYKKNHIEYEINGATSQAILPKEYQQVEYIESTGTQYINTGIVPNTTTKLETVFQYTKTYTSGSHFNGISWDYGRFGWGVVKSLSNNFVYSIGSGNFNSYVIADTQKHTLLMQANGFCRMDATEYTYDVATMQGDVTIPIFARSDEFGKISGYSDMRLFSYKLYSDNTIVRDLIPCYRKADGDIGLYDLVNNVFYTNQGTGTFLKGTDYHTQPTSNYPQPIENANNNGMGVTLRGDNLFNQEDLLTDSNFAKDEYNGEECIKVIPENYLHTFALPSLIPSGTEISFSFDVAHPNTKGNFYIYVVYEDTTEKAFIWYENTPSTVVDFVHITGSIVATKNVTSIKFAFFERFTYRPYYFKNFMLNIGEPKPYEPYFREEIAIPTSVDNGITVLLPFSQYDKLIVDRTKATEKVMYMQGAGYRKFTGAETFGTITMTGETPRFTILPSQLGFPTLTGNGYCSHFEPNVTMYFKDDPIDYSTPKKITFLYEAESADDFKAWVASQYSAGTPLTILAEFESPIVHDITETTLGQSLLNLATQNQTNYIEVTGNANAPETPIKITYAKWGELVENNGNT